MRVGEVLLAIYGGKDSWDGAMNSRIISTLVPLRQGEVITPYVHINRENVSLILNYIIAELLINNSNNGKY